VRVVFLERRREQMRRLGLLLLCTTLPRWCCWYVMVLMVRAGPVAAVGQHVPTEFSKMTREKPPENGWMEKSECTAHSQCVSGKFCQWTWCGDTVKFLQLDCSVGVMSLRFRALRGLMPSNQMPGSVLGSPT
jgi:hypothetical protein